MKKLYISYKIGSKTNSSTPFAEITGNHENNNQVEYATRVFDLIFIPNTIPFKIIHLIPPNSKPPKTAQKKHQNSP